MSKHTFEKVNTLLASPDLSAVKSLKVVMRDHGFREFKIGNGIEEITTEIGDVETDLLICEAVFPEGDPCDLIHALRHHEIGGNPFLPVIMITGAPSQELVDKVINSGADDLLVKPISIGQLVERINILVHSRKSFVVTSDYIGPDRRNKAHPDSSPIPLIDVPNSLHAKAVGGLSSVDSQQAIDEAIANVNLHKLERHAIQIAVLVEMILPVYQKGQATDMLPRYLDRLYFVAEDASRRLVGTKYDHVSELCQTLVSVTGGIRAKVENPDRKDVELLKPLSQAVRNAFDVTEDIAALARKISASVADRKDREVAR